MTKVIIYREDGHETTINAEDIGHMTVYRSELVVEYKDGHQESFGTDADIYFD